MIPGCRASLVCAVSRGETAFRLELRRRRCDHKSATYESSTWLSFLAACLAPGPNPGLFLAGGEKSGRCTIGICRGQWSRTPATAEATLGWGPRTSRINSRLRNGFVQRPVLYAGALRTRQVFLSFSGCYVVSAGF